MIARQTAVSFIAATGIALIVAACGDDDGSAATDAAAPTTTTSSAATITPEADSPCGVTLAEVQDLLPAGSGVTENTTPDAGRCNFTWDDGGPRGIDVAIVPGGRSSFEVPAGYEPLTGYGDEAYAATAPGRASALAYVGDDLYAADVVADGSDADLHALCLQLLDLTLD